MMCGIETVRFVSRRVRQNPSVSVTAVSGTATIASVRGDAAAGAWPWPDAARGAPALAVNTRSPADSAATPSMTILRMAHGL